MGSVWSRLVHVMHLGSEQADLAVHAAALSTPDCSSSSFPLTSACLMAGTHPLLASLCAGFRAGTSIVWNRALRMCIKLAD